MQTNHILQVEFSRDKADASSMTVPAVLSTEFPVDRKQFIEVLSHKQGAIDTSRFPLPVIESHDGSKVNIGIVENPTLSNGKLRGLVRLGTSARAKEIFNDIQAGIVKNLSIGYEWLEYQETGNTVLVTKWRLFELSIVSIPADPEAGFFRGINTMKKENLTGGDELTENQLTRQQELEFRAKETARREQIRGQLQPFADRHPDIVLRCLDDMSITPEVAGRLMLEAIGKDNHPVTSTLTNDQMHSYARHAIHDGYEPQSLASGRTHTDGKQIRLAMVDGLLLRSGMKVKNQHPAAFDFRNMSLHEMARIMLKESGRNVSGMSNGDLIQRAMSTSDLPYLLQDTANKALISGFESSNQSHDAFATFVDVNDFKTQSRVALSAFDNLEIVGEYSEVTHATGFKDSQETYQIYSYQKAISFSRQMLINDDLSQLTSIPEKLGIAARRTEADLVYSIFNSNPAMVADGVALFHANHKNLMAASALSETSLAAGIALLRKAKDISGRGYLGIKPKWLLVPPELEFTALKIIAAVTNTKANAGALPDSDLAKIEVVVEPRLTSATAWYLLGSGIETIEVGRLSSSYGSGISFETEQDFNTDAYNYKVRLDAGAKAISPIGMIKNPGA